MDGIELQVWDYEVNGLVEDKFGGGGGLNGRNSL